MLVMGTTYSSLDWKIVSNVTDSPVVNVRMNVYHVRDALIISQSSCSCNDVFFSLCNDHIDLGFW